MKELSLTQPQQKELNDIVEQHKGLRAGLKSLAFDLGIIEDSMWDLAKSFAGERKIFKIKNDKKNVVILLEDAEALMKESKRRSK